jgi:DNA-binding NtrC family response regulator
MCVRFEELTLGRLTAAIERLRLVHGLSEQWEIEDLPVLWGSSLIGESGSPELPSLSAATKRFESLYVARVLSEARGNVSKAVEIAQIGRPAFYARLKKYGIDPDAFRQNLSGNEAAG